MNLLVWSIKTKFWGSTYFSLFWGSENPFSRSHFVFIYILDWDIFPRLGETFSFPGN